MLRINNSHNYRSVSLTAMLQFNRNFIAVLFVTLFANVQSIKAENSIPEEPSSVMTGSPQQNAAQTNLLSGSDSFSTELAEELPLVLTATRLRQAKPDVPATITIIEGDLIRDLGIYTMAEVFRLVPGMTVGYVRSGVPVVSYHGTVANEQRRLQVLIDGRSLYNPNLADVDWNHLPVAIEDIARIEVNRGPNAATYGSNSFLAVINIITVHPYDRHGATLRTVQGSQNFEKYLGTVGTGTEQTDTFLSFEARKNDLFDYRRSVEDPHQTQPFHDGYAIDNFNIKSVLRLDESKTMSFGGGYLKGIKDVDKDSIEPTPESHPDINSEDYYVSAKYSQELSSNHHYYLQAYYQSRDREQTWETCVHPAYFSDNLTQLFKANNNYALQLFSDQRVQAALVSGLSPGLGTREEDALASQVLVDYLTLDSLYKANYGAATVCGKVNQDISESRMDIEFQDTFQFNDAIRLVSGISYREDEYNSETFFNGSGQNHLTRVFGNLETKATQYATINLGGMWENDDQNGTYFSPRGAINIHLTPSHTFRFVLSEAVRTPDTFEQSVDWSYTARELTPPVNGSDTAVSFLQQQSPAGLSEEKIISREIGYYGNMPHLYNLKLDVRYFYDTLSDLISAPLKIYSFEPENNMTLTQQGIEVEASMKFLRDFVRLTYGYIDQDSRYTGTIYAPNDGTRDNAAIARLAVLESRLTAQNSGSFSWIHQFDNGINNALSWYIADTVGLFDYQRIDWRIGTSIPLTPKIKFDIAATYKRLLNDNPIMFEDNIYADQDFFYFETGLNF